MRACTLPCMSSRSVRVTPKPPSPKSCSQFIVTWEWHSGRRMNEAHSLLSRTWRKASARLWLSGLLSVQHCETRRGDAEQGHLRDVVVQQSKHWQETVGVLMRSQDGRGQGDGMQKSWVAMVFGTSGQRKELSLQLLSALLAVCCLLLRNLYNIKKSNFCFKQFKYFLN